MHNLIFSRMINIIFKFYMLIVSFQMLEEEVVALVDPFRFEVAEEEALPSVTAASFVPVALDPLALVGLPVP